MLDLPKSFLLEPTLFTEVYRVRGASLKKYAVFCSRVPQTCCHDIYRPRKFVDYFRTPPGEGRFLSDFSAFPLILLRESEIYVGITRPHMEDMPNENASKCQRERQNDR